MSISQGFCMVLVIGQTINEIMENMTLQEKSMNYLFF